MQPDPDSPPLPVVSAHSDGALASPLRPRNPEEWQDPVPVERESGRLHRLLWIFALLTIVLVAPSVIGNVQYAITSGRERAKYDVAREHVKDFNFDAINSAYRLIPNLVSPSVVSIRTSRGMTEGQGSGVIVDADDGYIVTNSHVMGDLRTADILLSDGRHGPASVVGVDPYTDIAVLKTEMGNLVAAKWGDSNAMEVGDMVWAVGSPYGLQKSVTSGILSAKERRGIAGTGNTIQEFIQTDAAVNPGNSGGPLVDVHGQIVGINTAIFGEVYQGISFAVPSEFAKKSYEQIREHGYIERGFLGVGPAVVPDEIARELGLERGEGVFVESVRPGTPAFDAGFKRFDVILTWDGEEFSDPTLLSRAIAGTPIGSDVEVEIVRQARGEPRKLKLTVRVAARPPDA
jgi:serine protease Do